MWITGQMCPGSLLGFHDVLPVCLSIQQPPDTPLFCTRPLSQRTSIHTQLKAHACGGYFPKWFELESNWSYTKVTLLSSSVFLPVVLDRDKWEPKTRFAWAATDEHEETHSTTVMQYRMEWWYSVLSLIPVSNHRVLLILSYKYIFKCFLLPVVSGVPALGQVFIIFHSEH